MVDALPPKKHLFYTNGLMLIIGGMIAVTLWNIADRPWAGLGIRWPIFSIDVLLLSVAIFMLYIADGVYSWISQKKTAEKLQDLSYIIPLNWKEYRHYIFLAFAAGISEEITFRGFLITYLTYFLSDVLYGNYVAIILPALVFSVSHLYQGWWAVIKIMVLAVFFGFIFMMSGSLLIVVILHILIDLISGLAGLVIPEYSDTKE